MATVSGEFCVPRCLCTKGWEISSWMFPVMQGDSQGHKKVGREGGEFSLPEILLSRIGELSSSP